jgi:maltooligosyltrehalose trehalohydrolase
VHGPSEVVDLDAWAWDDLGWYPPTLANLVLYELHVGTFTDEGTFDGVAKRIDHLVDLGVTCVELMPVAEFPGARNWGYDGVFPFAVQSTYGSLDGLRRLVAECHARGLAVALDVVFNHLGPEGNVLGRFGPYFTDRYRTPWGDAINLDGPGSDEVRRYFVGNALQWLEDVHVDVLRLDAIHGIVDASARPFLAELADTVHRRGAGLVIAESDLGDHRVVRSEEVGGLGMDAVWADDFHHTIHALLTHEDRGYYADFQPPPLATALRQGPVYTGQRSRARGRRHGNSIDGIVPERFVVFLQNHDQVGNRMAGDRLSTLATFEQRKLAAAMLLLSPFTPLLFMGEEYGEEHPFQYVVSHTDADLVDAVRRGRAEEFRSFRWAGEPPDPASEETFERSKLSWDLGGRHGQLLAWYRELLRLRRQLPALASSSPVVREIDEDRLPLVIRVFLSAPQDQVVITFNPTDDEVVETMQMGPWRLRVDSSEGRWGGPGTLIPETIDEEETVSLRPWSVAVFHRTPGPSA